MYKKCSLIQLFLESVNNNSFNNSFKLGNKMVSGYQVPLSSEETIYANELSDDKNKNDEDNEDDDSDMNDEERQ